MNYQLALTKDSLRNNLMNIIENVSNELNDKQTETLKGLLHLEKELSIENKDLFCKDVDYSLGLCVNLINELEYKILNDEFRKEFIDICDIMIQVKNLEDKKHYVGELINYQGLAYQICEIDYEELTICINDNSDEMGGGMLDVSPSDINSTDKKDYIDYIDYIQPMIDDLKDGEPEPLTPKCIDGLMKVIRAKVEFKEGLITEDEYNTAIAEAYE